MATSPDAMRSDARDAQPAGSVLHMEMQAGDRRLLTLFASSFIAWIKDEAASSFVRDVGTPASISLDETARDAETPALHLTVTWSQSSTAAPAVRLVAVAPRTPPAAPDVTMLMASVLEESKRLRRRPARELRGPDWIPAPVVAGAARGRQVVARWTDAAIGSTAAVLDRSRARGPQLAAFWHSMRRAPLARAQSAVPVWRTRFSAGTKPMRWAAAGVLAASVIYVGWPLARPATNPVAPGIAEAANPSPSQPATVTAPQMEKAPAPLVADARPTEAEPVPTSGVVQAAPAIRAASPKPAQATANATRVQPAPQPRGYVGALVVTSEPQGADVSVDGVPHGRTPLAITNLNVGSRVVRLELPGHQRWSWAVSVVANRQTPVAVRLVPQASPPIQ